MSAVRVFMIAVAVTACGMGVAGAQSCQSAEGPAFVAGGVLAKRGFRDAAGRPETAYILDMPQAECLTGQEEEDNVAPTRRLHLYASQDAVARTLARLVGKRVMIEGRAFGAHTAHHHAPIVVDVTAIGTP